MGLPVVPRGDDGWTDVDLTHDATFFLPFSSTARHHENPTLPTTATRTTHTHTERERVIRSHRPPQPQSQSQLNLVSQLQRGQHTEHTTTQHNSIIIIMSPSYSRSLLSLLLTVLIAGFSISDASPAAFLGREVAGAAGTVFGLPRGGGLFGGTDKAATATTDAAADTM